MLVCCSSRQWEPAPSWGLGPQDPRLSSPAEWKRSAAIVRGTWGQYVAVCSVSNSPLTHDPFATLSQPFRIKCERYIFLKKCVRSSLLLILFPHVYMYSCIRITAMQHSLSVVVRAFTGSMITSLASGVFKVFHLFQRLATYSGDGSFFKNIHDFCFIGIHVEVNCPHFLLKAVY